MLNWNLIERELEELINRNNIDAQLQTPDYILSRLLVSQLKAVGEMLNSIDSHEQDERCKGLEDSDR